MIKVGDFVITYGVVMALGLYLVVGFVLSQTAWGRHVYAVGDDPRPPGWPASASTGCSSASTPLPG